MTVAPGWYPDSYGVVRWWDGRQWTGAAQPSRQATYIPPPRRSHTTRNVLLIIAGAIVVGAVWVSVAASSHTGSTTPSPGVSRGVGSQDASSDVKVGQPTYESVLGTADAPVTVTNHSSKRSDYSINLALETADGTRQIDTTIVYVQALEPGQVTTQKATFLQVDTAPPAGAKVVLTQVERTASS